MMPNNRLHLRFHDDGDGTGKLVAEAKSRGFSGTAGDYFSIENIQEFANALAEFPLPLHDNRRSITGGFGSEDAESVAQEHLGISVYPVDMKRGYIGIQVRMATELWKGARAESQHTAKLEIITTYEPLSRFSKDILSLLFGKIEEVVLVGD